MTDPTRPIRAAAPAAAPPGRRRRRRGPALVISLLAVAGILIGLDRIAAAYEENRIAGQLTSYGFPRKPDVTVQGFPFLTQVISRHLEGVAVRSSGLKEGPVRARLYARASDISLNSGYSGGMIARVNGTGLISFASIASAARAAGAPGLKVSRAGPHALKLTADLGVIKASGTATVSRTGPDQFQIHVISAGGLPVSLLGPLSNFTVHGPPLPLGLQAQGVAVTRQGVVIHVTGRHVAFGQ